jgi:transcription-repair coupling factor (superfamily II helicase)
MPNKLIEPLYRIPLTQKLQERFLAKENTLFEELWDSPKAFITALAQEVTEKHVLILTGGKAEEIRIFDDLQFFSETPIVEFPAWETLPSEGVAPSPDIVGERYNVLHKIWKGEKPHIVLTSLQACLQRLIPPAIFDAFYLSLQIDDYFPFEDMVEHLQQMGYVREMVASDKGEFAIRGGIIDVYPVNSPDPFRIEFGDDKISSLRIYDPISQKSVKPTEKIEITPGQEMEILGTMPKLGTLLDYLGPDTMIVFDDLAALEDRYVNLLNLTRGTANTFMSIEDFLKETLNYQKIYLTKNPLERLTEVKRLEARKSEPGYGSKASGEKVAFNMFGQTLEAVRWRLPFRPVFEYFRPVELTEEDEMGADDLFHGLQQSSSPDAITTFLCPNESDIRHLKQQILESGATLPEGTRFESGYLSSGFVYPETQYSLIPLTELTHRYRIRRQKMRSTYHSTPSEFIDLSPGDTVVHLHNGIGLFLGIETKPNFEGIETEFFLIEYANQAKLYVPLTQAYLISKYVGVKEEAPKLHELGSAKWRKAKALTEQAILGYASDLLKLYAEREIKGGFAYPEDSLDMIQFEEDFPFQETEDQLSAIEAIKRDMISGKSMDRLVCGDVGYGKTEVAMRAALKAVVDGGKQVAVLVPTTVLAMQHFDNFCARMENYPVRIGVLSRFRTPKQTKETIEQIAAGTVDVVIGTHRIVSEDVKFKDLGLVIIDEEQRFGVRAKEHLKKIKAGVDCITLSATPIPRTLYMSLVGARDMSVIASPPHDRLPIKTIICEKGETIIESALLRELTRDGQAFVIHNRVETIYEEAGKIQRLLPQARVLVAHGQMDADDLDIVFHKFRNGEADVLVATTIIESGIDIPNANTILIDRADTFGLSDLYQLRGRVGRWNRQAFAYFMTPKKARLTPVAKKRLAAISEAKGYGGGMKIAMRDLEIRGAGDILGTEQSGHVAAVGFHLYCKLLKRTVDALQGKMPSVLVDTKLEFPYDCRLPKSYVNAESLRMDIYQRLGEAVHLEDLEELWRELKDRFGAPPTPVKWLYHLSRIRVFAQRHGITLIKQEKIAITVERKVGKETELKQMLVAPSDDPAEWEGRIITGIKKTFQIK